jgi:SNW domain-containing protein 1
MAALAAYAFLQPNVVEVTNNLLFSLLPQPAHAPVISDHDDNTISSTSTSQLAVVARTVVPPYGQRRGWKPSGPEDFGR